MFVRFFKIIFSFVFCFLNILFLVINLLPKKDVINNNNYVSISKIDNYYYDEKYDSNSKHFKLKSRDGVSSIDVYYVDNLISNEYLYTEEELVKSINYQILNNLDDYEQTEFSCSDGYGYSKNVYKNMIIEISVEFIDDKIVVICYSSNTKFFDSTFMNYIKKSIRVVGGVV